VIKLRTNGFAFNKTYKGNFKLKDETKAKLFIKDGIPPYIFIKTDKMNVYLNLNNYTKTVALIKALTTRCKQVE
jgi:hypothetical protein